MRGAFGGVCLVPMSEGGEDEGGARQPYSHSIDISAPVVPHYYGDVVRRIFVVAAAVLLLLSPSLASASDMALPLAVLGAIVLASLAAITTPRKRSIMIIDAVVSAAGVFVSELFAIASWNAEVWFWLALSQALAVSFLFSLYFSMKTVRAMLLDQVGRGPSVGEFLEGEASSK